MAKKIVVLIEGSIGDFRRGIFHMKGLSLKWWGPEEPSDWTSTGTKSKQTARMEDNEIEQPKHPL